MKRFLRKCCRDYLNLPSGNLKIPKNLPRRCRGIFKIPDGKFKETLVRTQKLPGITRGFLIFGSSFCTVVGAGILAKSYYSHYSHYKLKMEYENYIETSVCEYFLDILNKYCDKKYTLDEVGNELLKLNEEQFTKLYFFVGPIFIEKGVMNENYKIEPGIQEEKFKNSNLTQKMIKMDTKELEKIENIFFGVFFILNNARQTMNPLDFEKIKKSEKYLNEIEFELSEYLTDKTWDYEKIKEIYDNFDAEKRKIFTEFIIPITQKRAFAKVKFPFGKPHKNKILENKIMSLADNNKIYYLNSINAY